MAENNPVLISKTQLKNSQINPPLKCGDTNFDDLKFLNTYNNESLKKDDKENFLEENKLIEINSVQEEIITFIIKENEKISYNKHFVLNVCPAIARKINHNLTLMKISIVLPKWISKAMLTEFFIYYYDNDYDKFTVTSKQLLLVSEYFENDCLVTSIIKNEIIPYLSNENCLRNLEDSFYKSCLKNFKNEIWFIWFYESLFYCGKNFIYLLQNHFEKIKSLNQKLLEEIIEKFLLINHLQEIENFINIMNDTVSLMKIVRSSENIYDIITNEHLRLSSERYIDEIISVIPQIAFSFKLNNFFQQEINNILIDGIHFGFEIINKTDTIIINYKIISKTFNTSFKLFSFYFIVIFHQNDKSSKPTNKYVLSNYENKHLNILVLNDVKSLLNKMNKLEEIQIKIYLKITYLDSLFQNFLIFNFNKLCCDIKLKSLSKYNIICLMKNTHLEIHTQNELVAFIGTWLLDEKNIETDFVEIINLIQWNEVTIEVLFEFIIKFSNLIEKFQLESLFSICLKQSLNKSQVDNNIKYKDSIFTSNSKCLSDIVVEALFNSSKKVELVNLYQKLLKNHDFKPEKVLLNFTPISPSESTKISNKSPCPLKNISFKRLKSNTCGLLFNSNLITKINQNLDNDNLDFKKTPQNNYIIERIKEFTLTKTLNASIHLYDPNPNASSFCKKSSSSIGKLKKSNFSDVSKNLNTVSTSNSKNDFTKNLPIKNFNLYSTVSFESSRRTVNSFQQKSLKRIKSLSNVNLNQNKQYHLEKRPSSNKNINNDKSINTFKNFKIKESDENNTYKSEKKSFHKEKKSYDLVEKFKQNPIIKKAMDKILCRPKI